MALSLFQNRDLFSMPDELLGPIFRPFDTAIAPTFRAREMALDVKELDDKFEVKADIPGVNKEDIHVSVDQNVLTLKVDSKSEKEEEKEEEGVKWHRYERQSTFMQRSLRMPQTANMDEIKAKYENGVLTLDVAKKETNGEKAHKRIDIQ